MNWRRLAFFVVAIYSVCVASSSPQTQEARNFLIVCTPGLPEESRAQFYSMLGEAIVNSMRPGVTLFFTVGVLSGHWLR
jgi:hypothetical protein